MTKRTVQNAAQMKFMNRLRILRLIRSGPVARSELAVKTGLTRAAISLIVADLLDEGAIVETGIRSSATGRKPILLELRPGYAYSVGLSISRAEAEVGVVDFSGHLVRRSPLSLRNSSRAQALRQIGQAVMRMIASGSPGQLLGLGISMPGPVDVMTGTVLNPPNFTFWHGARMRDGLRDIAAGRVFLENNAQALTMAEKAYGKGREFNSFLLLVVESGIGAGIYRGEERHTGWRGFGNEVGHTSINFEGPLCGCGLKGCVEVYASVPAVLGKARIRHTKLQHWSELIDLAHRGDTVCCRLIEEQARALSTAVVNVLNVFELDAVVLTGDILYRGEMLRSKIEQHVGETAINRGLRHIPVHLSTLGAHSALAAAAGIATERFFQGELEPDTRSTLRRAG